jgi:CheY-like chemotaxis protein
VPRAALSRTERQQDDNNEFIALMTRAHAIALLGFTPDERASFESFFRMAARRVQGFDLVSDAARCDLVLANADDRAVMDTLLDHPPAMPVLLVGADDADTGWPVEHRPIKLIYRFVFMDVMLDGMDGYQA